MEVAAACDGDDINNDQQLVNEPSTSTTNKIVSLYPREAEFFKICPIEFMDALYSMVDSKLETIPFPYPRTGGHRVLDKVWKSFLERSRGLFDKNFDKFELYCLRNIFLVPTDMITSDAPSPESPVEEQPAPLSPATTLLLENKTPSITAEEEEALDIEIQTLQQELQHEMQRNGQLKANHAVLDRNTKKFNSIVEAIDFSCVLDIDTNALKDSVKNTSTLVNAIQKMTSLQSQLGGMTEEAVKLEDSDAINRMFREHTTAVQISCINDASAFKNRLLSL